MTISSPPLLEARNLRKYFPLRSSGGPWGERRWLRAVDGVSMVVGEGETLGVVGESGCGKTTLGRLLLRLIEPTEGEIYFDGEDLRGLDAGRLRARRRDMQIVFQDPYSSLNPRMTAGAALAEALRIHGLEPGGRRRGRVAELLEMVGLGADQADKYPHEFSGGQRQRLGIARALAVRPRFIVADEPVSALDVSIQAQIVNLLQDLQRGMGLTYLFIAHDLNVVRHISDRIAVMYLGRIVETGRSDDVYRSPKHPYTRALLAAIPQARGAHPAHVRQSQEVLQESPDAAAVPSGCPYHPRCPERTEACRAQEPRLVPVGPGHRSACLLHADSK